MHTHHTHTPPSQTLSHLSHTPLTPSGMFTRFRNPKDKRDFVTAGAAVGIATAFGAPIGGLLFVFEEVASFWQHELGWQIFFACMVAVLSLDTFRSAQAAVLHGGAFGWFSGAASTVLYEVQTALAIHVAFIGPAVVIGVACGLCGILFTIGNVKVMRLRQEIIGVCCVLWCGGVVLHVSCASCHVCVKSFSVYTHTHKKKINHAQKYTQNTPKNTPPKHTQTHIQ